VIGYLGVTSADLYAKDFNFLFGWAGDRYGVLSYHRFSPEFNGEKPEGSALKDRTFKQMLSSTLRVLGISKCSTPDCAAAYPNSLDEHDRKGTRLCPRCKQQIQTVVHRHRQTGRGIPETGK
jgi:predicted Zn-dependent protease